MFASRSNRRLRRVSALRHVREELGFPTYFGRNWDAFIDYLSDLSWINEMEVTVAHEDLPSLQAKDLRTYLECLLDCDRVIVHSSDSVSRMRIGRRLRLRLGKE